MLNLSMTIRLLLVTLLVLIPATIFAHGLDIFDDFSSTAEWDVHDGTGPSTIFIDTANKRLVTSINRNSEDTLWALRAVPLGTNDYELTYGFYVESFTSDTFVKFGLHGSQETFNTGSATHYYPYHNLRIGTPLNPVCYWYDGVLSLSSSPGPTLAGDHTYWARLTKNGLDYRCEIYSDKFETLLWGATVAAPSELNLTQVGADQTHDNFGVGQSIIVYNIDMKLRVGMNVSIDIMPGSDPNCFNNDGHGIIRVAILSSAAFDASTVDPATISLDGVHAQANGKSGKVGAFEDVNSDGLLDLVVRIPDVEGTYEPDSTVATLAGSTFDGIPIHGSDEICISLSNPNETQITRIKVSGRQTEFIVSADQKVVIWWRWAACTREQIQDFISALDQNDHAFDGNALFESLEEANELWGASEPFTGSVELCVNDVVHGWVVFWEYELGQLEPGLHVLRSVASLGSSVTDGADPDGDGIPLFYIGTVFDNELTIKVE